MINPSQLRFGKELEKLQISDILLLIQNKIDESQNLEYKEPSKDLNKDCNNLSETISGFLNTDGGILVYGVSERSKGDHRYASDLSWCDTAKERLESLLISRIQPWEERIKIHRIKNKEEENEGIFVIEVPKSNSPPHMHNYRYYQRLNFQTKPMTHQNVLRAFQTSWIRRRDLHQNVIEPLYSEIKLDCEKIKRYQQGEHSKYQGVILENRYLYDLIESSLQRKIDKFYGELGELNSKLGGWTLKIATKIINKELCRTFPDYKDYIKNHMENDYLFASVTVIDPSGSRKIISKAKINGALLHRTTVKSYLQSQHRNRELVKYGIYFQPNSEEETRISDSTFKKLWKRCVLKAVRNKRYLSIWNETSKLVALGRETLGLMSSKGV